MVLPLLEAIAKGQRPWTGQPSVTQLISGTRCEYLKIVSKYSADPDRCIPALWGTKTHLKIQASSEKGDEYLTEEGLVWEGIVGHFDLYYIDNKNHVLCDYKTTGSYKVAKSIGFTDSKSGKYTPADVWEWQLQLNMYRLMLQATGFPVDRMLIQVFVRDGETYLAKQRGIHGYSRLIEISPLPDDQVKRYFIDKKERLLFAIKEKQLPPPCDDRERWDGEKCKSWCDVRSYCDYGR
jgi:hypothetical protein